MADIIDFSKYKELAKVGDDLAKLLADLGADHDIIEFAIRRQKELHNQHQGLVQYAFSVSLNSPISEEDQKKLYSQVQQVIAQVNEKLVAENSRLTAQLLLAEIKLFQYERIRGKNI